MKERTKEVQATCDVEYLHQLFTDLGKTPQENLAQFALKRPTIP